MLEEKKIHDKRIQKSQNPHTKTLIAKLLTCTVISVLLLTTTMVLALTSQQPARAQPTPAPAPSPSAAPGQAPQIPQRDPTLPQIQKLSPESVQSLKSIPQLLERSVANLPNIPPNTDPAGRPIPGKFIAVLKTPTTIPTGPAGQ